LFDDNTSYKEKVEENEETYSRFNAGGVSSRRANRPAEPEDLKTVDGDD
jgi:hypothetical protein